MANVVVSVSGATKAGKIVDWLSERADVVVRQAATTPVIRWSSTA